MGRLEVSTIVANDNIIDMELPQISNIQSKRNRIKIELIKNVKGEMIINHEEHFCNASDLQCYIIGNVKCLTISKLLIIYFSSIYFYPSIPN